MKTRTLVILGVVLAALAVAATAPSWWPTSEDDAPGSAAATTAVGLEELDVDDVDEIRVRRAGADDPIVATRDGSEWTVASKPANEEAITSFLDALEELDGQDATLVSRSADRHKQLGLTVASGSLVTLVADGGDSVELLVGNGGDVAQSYYARAADDDRSWQLRGELLAALPADAAAWQASDPAPKPAADAA